MNETDLLHRFIERAPHSLPGVHVERRNILNVQTVLGFRARNGRIGQADAFAIYLGRHVEIETKAARGTVGAAQEAWRRRCLDGVGPLPPLCPHLVLKAAKGESPDDTVGRWIAELGGAIHVS